MPTSAPRAATRNRSEEGVVAAPAPGGGRGGGEGAQAWELIRSAELRALRNLAAPGGVLAAMSLYWAAQSLAGFAPSPWHAAPVAGDGILLGLAFLRRCP